MNNPTLVTDTGLNQYGVGCALITQLSLTFKKDVVVIPNDVVVIQVGLDIYNEFTQQWETIYTPLGTFYVDSVEEKGITKSIKAYDRMYKLNKGYFPSAKHTTTYAIANDISTVTGLKLKGISSNANNVKINNDQLDGKTQIEMLSLIASAIGGHVRISRDGSSIEFIEPTNHGEVYTESDYTTPTLDDATSYHITKLRINYSDKVTNDEGTVTDEGYYEVGTGTEANTLELSNPLLKGQQAQATNVLNKIKKLNGYKRFDTTLRLADFRLDPLDLITYTKGEIEYIVPILYMKMTLTYRGISIETQSPTVAETKSEFSFKGILSQKVENIYADIIQVKQLTANKVTTDELEATVATIEKLYVKYAQFDSLVANSIAVQEINANIANINTLVAGKADISELNAAVANINILNADLAVIQSLVAGNISSENIQTGGITSDKLTIANGFIKDAMIDSLNANKIKAGQINTALVQVTSSSGNLVINDNTIQIRDANRVRVQIGKDASNDYSMSVWDSNGNLMFDARGLKADAIKDSIIRDEMISSNANIDGSKLNISSVVNEINEGATTLKASKVQFDGIAQTLEVAFNVLKTQADGTKSQAESNTTAINVAQGKINTLIQDTTITKDGQTVKLKDEYSKLEQTVGSLSSTIGKQQTTIDDHTGKITAFNSEIVSLKQNFDGLSASVSTAQTTLESQAQLIAQKANSADVYVKTEVYTKAQTDAAIKIAKDEINLGVSSTYETKTNVTTKVNSAITTASNDATNKANSALSSAKSYADTKKSEAITSANNTLNTTIANYYTKTQTDSQINIAKNAITQSVANTYETKANVTAQINGVNSSISSLTSRMTSAESKITDTAITNTVKKNFYTKEETDKQITSKGYATSSEVQQTSDALIAKFSASGGYNLIRNSGFLKDFNFWGTQSYGSPTGGSIGSINSTADWGFPNARINTAQIRLSNQSNIEYGLKCAVDTTINKLYTIRFRYAAHRVNEVNVIVRNGGNGWHTNKYIKAPYTYSGGKGSDANWGTFTHTFRANSTSHILNFVITNASNDGYFWIAEPMVFEGDIDSPYSPHPSEVYWGQTLIDQNGIRVNASNVGTYTEMNAGGFFVRKNDGNLLFEATNKVALYNGKGVSCVEIVNDPNANYGNARIDVRGGINFVHNPSQSTGLNQILLGNHDVSNQYGMHNMFIRCHNSLGFADNYGWTHMFADVRRGRWIMKGALYQNTATPPSTFSMNFDGEDEVYNSGYSRELAVDSIMNLKTGVYVDNDGECCSAIYGGFSELLTTEYEDEDGNATTHLNTEALNASLVVTCQEQQKLIEALQKELNEIKEYLKVA